MAKTVSEVEVLRFFEESPIEMAEVLFNIVSVKMRERLGRNRNAGSRPKEKDAVRKQRVVPTAEPASPNASNREPL